MRLHTGERPYGGSQSDKFSCCLVKFQNYMWIPPVSNPIELSGFNLAREIYFIIIGSIAILNTESYYMFCLCIYVYILYKF